MDKKRIKKILQDLKKGNSTVSEALEGLKNFPYDDIGFAKIDTHRELRKGFAEVIFCRGKSLAQITGIFKRYKGTGTVMATKADCKIFDEVKKIKKNAVYFEEAGIILAGKKKRMLLPPWSL